MAPATARIPFFLGVLLVLPSPVLPVVAPAGPEGGSPAQGELTIETLKAKAAAESARTAAHQAKEVAAHSMRITEHAQSALKHAHKAVHSARVETKGLTEEQKAELKKAEEKLHEATKAGQYSNVTSERERAVQQKLKEKMEAQAGKHKQWKNELDQMREEVQRLQKKLEGTKQEKQLREIEEMLRQLADERADGTFSHEELKAELERLRDAVQRIKDTEHQGSVEIKMAPKTKAPERFSNGVKSQEANRSASITQASAAEDAGSADDDKGSIDVDTEMPYGAIEPFGREDTAQELTEASIRESNKMVDQVERAEVAEEKRAVFRALTRLRGAAITSYDGVARSQTGNIDEYSKLNQWRSAHPLRHLAQDESDISKWAFPDANL